MRIIAVDDIKQNRYYLQKLLEGYGYVVETASNGVEALEKARASPPDMIITDTLMPTMDGFQLCRALKNDEKLKDIPVLFHSATYTDKKSRELALSIGAVDYVIKPIEPDEFIKIITAALEKYGCEVLKPTEKQLEEPVYMKLYNERLIHKLEKKMRDLEKTSKRLKESEQNYRELVDNANDAVIVIEPTGYFGFVNPKFCETTGYTMEEAKKLHISSLVHPEDVTMVTKNIGKRLAGEETPRNYEFRVLTKLGETIYEDYNASLIEREGKKVGVQAILRDITERKRAERRIEHLNSVLKAIRSVNQLIIVEKDRDSLLQKVCNVLVEARGYDAAWLGFLNDGFATVMSSGFPVSRFCGRVADSDYPPCIKNALVQKEMLVVVDKPEACGDCFFKRTYTSKEAAVIRVEHAGRLFGLLTISFAADAAVAAADEEEQELLKEVAGDLALALHDMELEAARKRAEEQIKASLKEKEVLLREIHHRVKNNLQIISSLLNMQARSVKDKKAAHILSESQSRITAMAFIHAQLYENRNLSAINMKGFVDGLLTQLFQSHPVQDTKITPLVRVGAHLLPISIAVPTGLIINELLTNAFKHAFDNRKEGQIEVILGVSEKDEAILTVSDNGVGLPEGFDLRTSKTLGLHMVEILVEYQLQGNLEIVTKNGTTFNIVFEIEK
jgi:PAS domain S-box-containing protein